MNLIAASFCSTIKELHSSNKTTPNKAFISTPRHNSANKDNKNFDSKGSECYLQHTTGSYQSGSWFFPDFFLALNDWGCQNRVRVRNQEKKNNPLLAEDTIELLVRKPKMAEAVRYNRQIEKIEKTRHWAKKLESMEWQGKSDLLSFKVNLVKHYKDILDCLGLFALNWTDNVPFCVWFNVSLTIPS
jgi:hypothetical protein